MGKFRRTVYVNPNPKQPFSQAEDCEQFCYKGRGDNSKAVFTVIDHITQTLHPYIILQCIYFVVHAVYSYFHVSCIERVHCSLRGKRGRGTTLLPCFYKFKVVFEEMWKPFAYSMT